MPLEKTTIKLSEKEYLEGEFISEIKHEYIDGYIYAMAGASENHDLISGNIFREIGNHLKQKKSQCNVFSSDMKVRISEASISFFYTDAMVICDKHEQDDKYYKHSPVIIVEVLSESTRKHDLTTKKLYYQNIPSLQEYVVIEQDICRIEVFRKSDDWRSMSYFLGDEIAFESIDSTISVEDIYYHVDNQDVVKFLNKKEVEDNK